jgi:hypothetical protein
MPNYFSTVETVGQYSFTGALKKPRDVLPGGYICWYTSDGTLWKVEADKQGKIGFESANTALTSSTSITKGPRGFARSTFNMSYRPLSHFQFLNNKRTQHIHEAHMEAELGRKATHELLSALAAPKQRRRATGSKRPHQSR